MRFFLLAIAAGTAAAQAIRGFNSGGIGPKGVKSQQDFEKEFNKIKNLHGTAPFSSVRLFTMIQPNTASVSIALYNGDTSAEHLQ